MSVTVVQCTHTSGNLVGSACESPPAATRRRCHARHALGAYLGGSLGETLDITSAALRFAALALTCLMTLEET